MVGADKQSLVVGKMTCIRLVVKAQGVREEEKIFVTAGWKIVECRTTSDYDLGHSNGPRRSSSTATRRCTWSFNGPDGAHRKDGLDVVTRQDDPRAKHPSNLQNPWQIRPKRPACKLSSRRLEHVRSYRAVRRKYPSKRHSSRLDLEAIHL